MDAHAAIDAAVRTALANDPAISDPGVGPLDPPTISRVAESAAGQAWESVRALPGFDALACALVRARIEERAWDEVHRINAARRREDGLYGKPAKRSPKRR